MEYHVYFFGVVRALLDFGARGLSDDVEVEDAEDPDEERDDVDAEDSDEECEDVDVEDDDAEGDETASSEILRLSPSRKTRGMTPLSSQNIVLKFSMSAKQEEFARETLV